MPSLFIGYGVYQSSLAVFQRDAVAVIVEGKNLSLYKENAEFGTWFEVVVKSDKRRSSDERTVVWFNVGVFLGFGIISG